MDYSYLVERDSVLGGDPVCAAPHQQHGRAQEREPPAAGALQCGRGTDGSGHTGRDHDRLLGTQ